MSSIYGIVNSALSALNTYTSAIDVVNTSVYDIIRKIYITVEAEDIFKRR